MGAYSRWALIRGWALIKFPLFSASVVCLFCKNQKKGNNKTRRSDKASSVKYSEENSASGKSLISTYSFLLGGRGKGLGLVVGAYLSLSGTGRGWALIRGWGLLTFSAFRMGAYSRWVLIRGGGE